MSVARFLGEWDGTVFGVGRPGEENITIYPLVLPRPDDVQPKLRGVGHLLNIRSSTVDFVAVRSHVR